ncbi:MAG: ABC transporter substrate-binding protein [Elusimicrobia bacterium]|nr:ABC transporter substrate-binding protein [Elusimicrobiota bacterium]
MTKRLAAKFLAVTLTAGIAQPANAEILSQIKNPDTFIYATIGDADSLDPAYAYDTASHQIIFQVYEQLVMFKGSSVKEYIPMLAEVVPTKANGGISADGMTYTFKIRKGVKFHDGAELTPEDIKYSLMRFMLQDRAGGPSALLLEPIGGVPSTRDDKGNTTLDFKKLEEHIKIDGQKLTIHLAKPYAPFLSVLAMWTYTVNKKWAAAHGDWDGTETTWKKYNNPKKENSYFFEHMNGTGAFMFEGWDKTTKQISLTRHENYWRAPAKLKRIVIKKVDEFATRRLLLDRGDVDSAYVSNQYEPQVAKIPGVKIAQVPVLDISAVFTFNFNINPAPNPYIGSGKLDGNGIPVDFFADKDVRLGFTYAYDQNVTVNDIYRGTAELCRGFIPTALPGYNPKQPVREFNLKKAEEHLRKAHGGKLWETGFRMVLPFNAGNDIRQTASNIFRKNLESLNPKFKVDVRPIQWSTLLSDESSFKLPMRYTAWLADFPDPHNFAFSYMHHNGAQIGRYRYHNPEADELVEKAVAEINPKKREQLYFDLTKIAYEDAPFIFGISTRQPLPLRDWVQGFYANPVIPDYFYFYPIEKSLGATTETKTRPKGGK